MDNWETGQPTATSDASQEKATRVVVTNFNIPYWDLVGYLFKLVFASIPVCLLGGIVFVFVYGLTNGR